MNNRLPDGDGVTGAVMSMSWIIGAFVASLSFYFRPDLPYLVAAIALALAFLFGLYLNEERTKSG